MCDRWRNNSRAFLADMGPAPSPQHTLERKDGKKGYEPSNCVWATRYQQSHNLSTNIRVKLGDFEGTLRQLADAKGLNYQSLWHYLKTRKQPLEKAMELATKTGEHRLSGQRRFYTVDITPERRARAMKMWEGGKAAWGR